MTTPNQKKFFHCRLEDFSSVLKVWILNSSLALLVPELCPRRDTCRLMVF